MSCYVSNEMKLHMTILQKRKNYDKSTKKWYEKKIFVNNLVLRIKKTMPISYYKTKRNYIHIILVQNKHTKQNKGAIIVRKN